MWNLKPGGKFCFPPALTPQNSSRAILLLHAHFDLRPRVFANCCSECRLRSSRDLNLTLMGRVIWIRDITHRPLEKSCHFAELRGFCPAL
jgi:hypothetical protein